MTIQQRTTGSTEQCRTEPLKLQDSTAESNKEHDNAAWRLKLQYSKQQLEIGKQNGVAQNN